MKERNYVFELLKVLAVALIVFLIADSLLEDQKFFAMVIACTPFGMALFSRVLPFNLFGNHDAVIIFWIIKIILSMIIGIIAMPIVIIYYIIKIALSFTLKIKVTKDIEG